MSTAPGPTWVNDAPIAPSTTSAIPATRTASPETVRTRDGPCTSSVPSLIAANGLTRDARTAGTRLAGTATATPTRAASANRAGAIASADDGSPNPAAPISA